MRFGRSSTVGFALLAIGSLTLTGCASNKEDTGTPTGSKVSVSNQADLASLVPAAIRAKGVLSIGVAPNYPPNEFVNTSNKIVGWDVDLMNAVAAKLGLKTTYENATFDNIVPGVTAGKYDVGVSSFTDNTTREKSVDFVDYFNAGTQWAGAKGKTIDPGQRMWAAGRGPDQHRAGHDGRPGPQQEVHRLQARRRSRSRATTTRPRQPPQWCWARRTPSSPTRR